MLKDGEFVVAKKGHFTALRSIEGVQQANFGRRTHTWEHVFFFPECADAVFQITEKPSTSEQAKEDVRGGSSGASQISIESDDLSGLEPVAKRTRMLEPCTKVLTTSQREAAAMCLRRQGCAEKQVECFLWDLRVVLERRKFAMQYENCVTPKCSAGSGTEDAAPGGIRIPLSSRASS